MYVYTYQQLLIINNVLKVTSVNIDGSIISQTGLLLDG